MKSRLNSWKALSRARRLQSSRPTQRANFRPSRRAGGRAGDSLIRASTRLFCRRRQSSGKQTRIARIATVPRTKAPAELAISITSKRTGGRMNHEQPLFVFSSHFLSTSTRWSFRFHSADHQKSRRRHERSPFTSNRREEGGGRVDFSRPVGGNGRRCEHPRVDSEKQKVNRPPFTSDRSISRVSFETKHSATCPK